MGIVPARRPGWLLDPGCESGARGMAAHRLPRRGQNPAYRPSGAIAARRSATLIAATSHRARIFYCFQIVAGIPGANTLPRFPTRHAELVSASMAQQLPARKRPRQCTTAEPELGRRNRIRQIALDKTNHMG